MPVSKTTSAFLPSAKPRAAQLAGLIQHTLQRTGNLRGLVVVSACENALLVDRQFEHGLGIVNSLPRQGERSEGQPLRVRDLHRARRLPTQSIAGRIPPVCRLPGRPHRRYCSHSKHCHRYRRRNTAVGRSPTRRPGRCRRRHRAPDARRSGSSVGPAVVVGISADRSLTVNPIVVRSRVSVSGVDTDLIPGRMLVIHPSFLVLRVLDRIASVDVADADVRRILAAVAHLGQIFLANLGVVLTDFGQIFPADLGVVLADLGQIFLAYLGGSSLPTFGKSALPNSGLPLPSEGPPFPPRKSFN